MTAFAARGGVSLPHDCLSMVISHATARYKHPIESKCIILLQFHTILLLFKCSNACPCSAYVVILTVESGFDPVFF